MIFVFMTSRQRSCYQKTLPDFLDKDQDPCARLLDHTLEVAVVPVISCVVNLEVVPAQARVPVNPKIK